MVLSMRNQLQEPYNDFIVREARKWVAQIPLEARKEFGDLVRARAALEGCAQPELLRAVLNHLGESAAPKRGRKTCTLIST